MGYYCNICKKDITKAEYLYSLNKFDRALCREHQELEKRAQEKSFRFERQEGSMTEQEPVEIDTKENIDSEEISVDGVQKSGWKSLSKKVAVKMGKGVIKGVKKIANSTKKTLQKRKWKEDILRRMTMSQLKRLCFEKKVSTKKTIEKEDKHSGELYWKELDCSKGELVSRLKNKTPLDAIISFAKRNRIDVRDVLADIERKKKEWEKKELTKTGKEEKLTGKEKEMKPEHQWRIKVLNRDNFKCRVCGKSIGTSAHHIYSRTYCQKLAPELEWDIRNGITACYECHKKITIDGKKWFKENKKYSKNG